MWKIDIQPEAKRTLLSFAKQYGSAAYAEVFQDMLNLEEDPLPPDTKPMRGTKDTYRIYTYRSRFRIIYQITPRNRVLILRFGPRSNVYSGYDKW